MDKYCISLELANELFKRGIIKDAEHWWLESKKITTTTTHHGTMADRDPEEISAIETTRYFIGRIPTGTSSKRLAPAPIAEELLEIMPIGIRIEDIRYDLTIQRSNNDNMKNKVFHANKYKKLRVMLDAKLSDALAKCLLWLTENNYT